MTRESWDHRTDLVLHPKSQENYDGCLKNAVISANDVSFQPIFRKGFKRFLVNFVIQIVMFIWIIPSLDRDRFFECFAPRFFVSPSSHFFYFLIGQLRGSINRLTGSVLRRCVGVRFALRRD